jgi:hypothetical protein
VNRSSLFLRLSAKFLVNAVPLNVKYYFTPPFSH